MQLTFGDRMPGLTVGAQQLHAAVFNENEVRAAAGITLVVGATAVSFALFEHQYVPLQVVTTFFFFEFLIRLLFGIRHSPVGVIARCDDAQPASAVGLGQAEALRLEARPGDGVLDGHHHERSGWRRVAARDAVRDLHGADTDGVGARRVPRLQAARPDDATQLARQGPRRWRRLLTQAPASCPRARSRRSFRAAGHSGPLARCAANPARDDERCRRGRRAGARAIPTWRGARRCGVRRFRSAAARPWR